MNTKELKQLIEENQKLIEHIEESADSLKVIVLRLLPECAEQFYLNGDFVVDEDTAVYRGYNLNPSECVLFKAGKEAARRSYEKKIEDLEYELRKRNSDEFDIESKLTDQIKLFEDLKKQFQDHLKLCTTDIAKLEKANSEKQRIIEELQCALAAMTADKEKQENAFQTKLSEIIDNNGVIAIEDVGKCSKYGIVLEE